MIRNGNPVRCDHKIILGNLDIGKIDLPTEDGETFITSIIEIKDSQIYGDINFTNALFKNDFETSVDFTKTIFHGRVNFHSTSFCDGANFTDAEFHNKANFEDSKFYSAFLVGQSSMNMPILGKLNFMKAPFLMGYNFIIMLTLSKRVFLK